VFIIVSYFSDIIVFNLHFYNNPI